MLILRVLQVNNSLLSDLIDTNITNCHIVSNAYWGHHDSPPSCEEQTPLSTYTLSLQTSSHSRLRLQARLLIAILSWYFVWCILSLSILVIMLPAIIIPPGSAPGHYNHSYIYTCFWDCSISHLIISSLLLVTTCLENSKTYNLIYSL